MAGKMGGAGRRSKGQRGEREVIALLQPILDEECLRAGKIKIELKRNLLQTREGGCDIAGLEWMSLEVKRHENEGQIGSWWTQTLKQCRDGQTPILVWRRNQTRWSVRMKEKVMLGKVGIRLTMDVDIETFLVYFRYRVRQELTR